MLRVLPGIIEIFTSLTGRRFLLVLPIRSNYFLPLNQNEMKRNGFVLLKVAFLIFWVLVERQISFRV